MNLLGDFHFLRPAWLLLLALLPVLLWAAMRHAPNVSRWREVCDPELLSYLGYEPTSQGARKWLALLAVAWVIASVSAAGPAFREQPQALFKRLDAQVVLFDLSNSMRAGDLAPTRLEQARFKLIDLLDRIDEGQVALIAYAGEPFIVSPLTDDANTVRNMVNALDPSIMPAPGSEADEALSLAGELLARVSDTGGQIIIMTDDVGSAAIEVARELRERGIRVSALGVGTPEGAPIAMPQGGVLTAADGSIVLPQLDEAALADLAAAGGGRYVRMSSDASDLDALFGVAGSGEGELAAADRENARWQDEGPWLVLLLLPLVALVFRKGVVLLLAVGIGLSSVSTPSGAASWAGLWKTPEQRAAAAMADESYEQAAELAEDPLRRGNAHYRQGDFEAAARAYASAGGADGAYNLGNALARQERFEDAIAAYDRALADEPEHEDAAHNKKLLEDLLDQQKQEQQDQQQEQDPSDQEQQEQQDSEGEGEDQEEQEQQQQPQEGEEQESEQPEPQPEPSEEELDAEERQALEQWLRRIPDDPGGLLRRKFLLEYQRRGSPPPRNEEEW